uniref:Uncharacterized protein n=1 Tax=Arundo donax TaxID=35708 RepID=A0A0A9HL54_ARUDO
MKTEDISYILHIKNYQVHMNAQFRALTQQ